MRGENIIKIKSFAFALSIVKSVQSINSSQKEYIMSKQLLRSGTSIGALVYEAQHAESKKDFIHKFSIALKEANETKYWLKLLHNSNYLEFRSYQNLKSDLMEIIKLLISIINASKNSLKSK